jgi:hypothetical protein
VIIPQADVKDRKGEEGCLTSNDARGEGQACGVGFIDQDGQVLGFDDEYLAKHLEQAAYRYSFLKKNEPKRI